MSNVCFFSLCTYWKFFLSLFLRNSFCIVQHESFVNVQQWNVFFVQTFSIFTIFVFIMNAWNVCVFNSFYFALIISRWLNISSFARFFHRKLTCDSSRIEMICLFINNSSTQHFHTKLLSFCLFMSMTKYKIDCIWIFVEFFEREIFASSKKLFKNSN